MWEDRINYLLLKGDYAYFTNIILHTTIQKVKGLFDQKYSKNSNIVKSFF